MIAIAGGTFLVFIPHTILWGFREFTGLAPKREGRKRIRRFTLVQRLFHSLLMASFLIQAATGLARLFSGTPMGNYLVALFGGFSTVIIIHKWAGIFMLVLFAVHIFYVLSRIDWRRFPRNLLGPDSILPSPDDLRQAVQHVGWLLGKNKLPRFDRWGYWEKFDYWAVFWGMFIIGGTGIMLFKPTLTSLFLPGWLLNVALWVHRIEAILAMAHVFTIHFFIGHLRLHNFPMDLAMFQGSVDLEAARHEKPGWIERLEKENRLDQLLEPDPGTRRRVIFYLIGYSAMAAGTILLVGGIISAFSTQW
ncbi:MAG: cytochrome b/b6 domain-containing protein [Deltaproteobacteria bacterium]|nr:cytochrome b/b6 domain-containing protein [Deltaproteobacteria bacterium]